MARGTAFVPWTGWGGGSDGFRMIWKSLHLLCTLRLLLLHQPSSDHQTLDPRGWGPSAVNWSLRKSLNADAEGICLREREKLEGNCSAKHRQLCLRLEDLKTKH